MFSVDSSCRGSLHEHDLTCMNYRSKCKRFIRVDILTIHVESRKSIWKIPTILSVEKEPDLDQLISAGEETLLSLRRQSDLV